MLNTSALKKNNINDSAIKKMINETIIDQGIRKVEEATNTQTDYDAEEQHIAKSFHAMEGNIFGSKNILGGETMINTDIKTNMNINTTGNFNISKFDFGEITKKYSDEEIRKNIFENEKKLMICINESLKKISVLDDANNSLGYFTINHIAKYLGDIYDTKQQFIKDMDPHAYSKAKELIKILIFHIKYNKRDKYTDIVLKDYTNSGFMGDIELLIKLNNLLYLYQNDELQNDLSKVDIRNRIKIETNIKKFIFLLLNYTLKLISIVSPDVKNNSNNQQLKEHLTNYSVGIIYRINLFVQDQLKIINNQNKNLKESINRSNKIKEEIKEKVTILVDNITSQNNLQKQVRSQINSKPRKKVKYQSIPEEEQTRILIQTPQSTQSIPITENPTEQTQIIIQTPQSVQSIPISATKLV